MVTKFFIFFLLALPPIVHEKLEREMDMVRYNMALSWLMNPNHSRAAFTALIYGIKHFPMDTRLWLHTAEACVAFLCSKTANKVRWWQLLSV